MLASGSIIEDKGIILLKEASEMRREVNIDLLKIVSMFLIVADHIVFWGGWGMCSCQPGLKGWALSLMNTFCLYAVNCFVLASGWVMSRKDFKISRIVKLWLEVEFYSAIMFVIGVAFSREINFSWRELIFSLLPLTMNRYWFFTQYVGLFFLMPFLNCAIQYMDKRAHLLLVFVGLVLFSLHPFLLKNDMFHVNHGYGIIWFAFLYYIAGVAAKYGVQCTIPMPLLIVTTFACGVCAFGSLKIFSCINSIFGFTDNLGLFDAYNSPFIFGGSVAWFLIFSKIDVSKRMARFVSFAAPSIFSVYLIHSNHFFRIMTEWNKQWRAFLDMHGLHICLLGVILGASIIFFGCIGIDVVRRGVFFVVKKVMRQASCLYEKYGSHEHDENM